MKKTMIALAMVCAAGLTVTMNDLHAGAGGAATATAPAGKIASAKKITAPSQELVIKGKKPAHFNHAKHMALGLDCGTCHHDAKHQPLTEAAIAGLAKADVLRCTTCHTANFANEKLRKPMDVFHARCKTCHTAGVNGKKGPSECTACHAATAAAPAQKIAPAAAQAPAAVPAPVAAPAVAPAPAKKKAVEGC